MITGEQGKSLTNVIQYITGRENIDITKINFVGFRWTSISFTHQGKEITLSNEDFHKGIKKLKQEITSSLELTGEL